MTSRRSIVWTLGWGALALAVCGWDGAPGEFPWRLAPPMPATHVASRAARDYERLRGAMLGQTESPAFNRVDLDPGAPLPSHSMGHDDRVGLLPSWGELPGPSLINHSAVYDSRRGRVIAVGGDSYPNYLNQLRAWVLDVQGKPSWSELVSSGPSPMPREGAAMIYDPLRDRVLLFGGWSDFAPPLNDLWELRLSEPATWTHVDVSGRSPAGRGYASAVYDPVHDAMIVFGGLGVQNGPFADTWSLSLSRVPEWHELEDSTAGLGARGLTSLAYDPRRNRVVMFGGGDYTHVFDDLWALSLAGAPAWSRLSAAGPIPPAREGHSLIYDALGDRMILFDGAAAGRVDDLWALSLDAPPTWTRLTPVGGSPPWHAGQSTIYDPKHRRMIIVGGIGDGEGNWEWGTDSWALSLAGPLAWSPLIGGGGLPDPRIDHSAIYDSARDRMVVLGGYAGGDLATLLGGVWALPLRGTGGWSLAWPFLAPVRARSGHCAVYDPKRDRMIVFGGAVDDGNEGFLLANDVWVCSFSLLDAGSSPWSHLEVAGVGPSPRAWARAIYDPEGDRMIVLGGYDGASLGDVWSLGLSGTPAWSELHPDGAGPGPLSAHTVVYDSNERRMLVFGGSDGTGCLGETWEMSLGERPAWSLVQTDTDPRLARTFHTAVYDKHERQMVIWGGYQCGTGHDVNDCWALSLKGVPTWHEIGSENAPLDAREGHTAVYDPEAERMVVFAGDGTRNDTWALPLLRTRKTSEDERETPALSAPSATGPQLRAPRPNPFDGGADLEFTLPMTTQVSLAVYDAGGRAVRHLADGNYAAGMHQVRWDGRDANGRLAASGLYFVRLASAGTVVIQKAVLARSMAVR